MRELKALQGRFVRHLACTETPHPALSPEGRGKNRVSEGRGRTGYRFIQCITPVGLEERGVLMSASMISVVPI